jgi:hypothetical protein
MEKPEPVTGSKTGNPVTSGAAEYLVPAFAGNDTAGFSHDQESLYGVSLLGVRLSRMTSRTLGRCSMTIRRRARPTPMPPCGGQP